MTGIKIVKLIGWLVVATSFFINPFYLDNQLSPDGHFDQVWVYWVLSFVGLGLLLFGLFFVFKSSIVFKKRIEILLLAVTILFCLAMVEIGLRFYDLWQKYYGVDQAFSNYVLPAKGEEVKLGAMIKLSANDNTVFELKPGLDVIFRNVLVKTNAEGFRDEEFETAKATTTIRIVGIGDSVMFGWEVDQAKRYLDLLEGRLKENYSNINWQTYNFAVPGYNIVNELAVLKEKALKYQPDLIIYGYYANDHCLPFFLKADQNFFSPGLRIFHYLNPYAKLVNYQLSDYSFLTWRNFLDVCEPSQAPEKYRKLVGLDVFKSSFEELLVIGNEMKVPVVVLVYEKPSFDHAQYIKEMSLKYDQFYFIDVHDLINDENQPQFALSDSDPHPSAAGHAFLAQQLYEQLASKGLFDKMVATKHDN